MIRYYFSTQEDGRLNSFEERQRFLRTLAPGIAFHEVYQTHSARLARAKATPQETYEQRADALVIHERPSTGIVIKTADCVPILIYDKRGKWIMGIHSGWRGTEKNIIRNALRLIDASHAMAVIGPSIGKCCYDIDKKRQKLFPSRYITNDHLDLSGVVTSQLNEYIPSKNIITMSECTNCKSSDYHSYRAHGAAHGTIVSALWTTI